MIQGPMGFEEIGEEEDFAAMLRKHKDEIVRIIRGENERKMRLAY